MITYEVEVNGKRVTVAGAADMSVLTVILTGVGKLGPMSQGTQHNPDNHEIDLRVGGMAGAFAAQQHVDWVKHDLSAGDDVVIRIRERPTADDPIERRPAEPMEEGRPMFDWARATYFRLREKYEGTDGDR